MAKRFGIDRGLGPNLAAALGSNEVTPLELTTAYAMIVNGGKQIEPDPDRAHPGPPRQDRDAPATTGPAPAARWRRLARSACRRTCRTTAGRSMDPRLAYQMVDMLEGVVERGTGVARARSWIGKPLAGKTGTTNDSQGRLVHGLLARSRGRRLRRLRPAAAARQARDRAPTVALPIWMEFMRDALGDKPAMPFRTPPGVQLVRVDAQTGTAARARQPSP